MQELINKWRDLYRAKADTFKECADQLEAALNSVEQPANGSVAGEQGSTNIQSAAIAKIADEMEGTVSARIKMNGDNIWTCDVSKWARHLRAL
jgi:hypothetical protein